MIKSIDHIVITSNNPSKCAEFYVAIGFKLHVENNKFALHTDTFKINIHASGNELSPHATNIKPGSCDFCFEIDKNLLVVQKELANKGFISQTGIVDRVGTYGSMQSIYYYDYDGNLIELSTYH